MHYILAFNLTVVCSTENICGENLWALISSNAGNYKIYLMKKNFPIYGSILAHPISSVAVL